MSFENIFNVLNKQGAAMITPEAQQAAMQPPPQDPSMGAMPPGGAPMDPAAMGAMPPQGAPMDPSMMGGAPAGAPPMDPAMAGGMPTEGAPMGQPGAWMQDQMFLQFLQSMGVQVQPDGSAIDPNGQPVPPEMMQQIYAQFQQEMAAQQGGAMPPEEGAPAGPEGAPPEQGAPQEGEMPPPGLDEESMNQIAGIIQEVVDATFQEQMSALDKKLSAFTEKIDAIKMLLDDFLTDAAHTEKKEAQEQARMDQQLEKDLKSAQESAPVDIQPTEEMLAAPVQEAAPAGNMLDIMRGNA